MKDQFTKNWIIENSINVISLYDPGVLTIRGLHYQLVGLGMTNTTAHYKRVVNAMIEARRAGIVSYETFSDRDRAMESFTRWETTIYPDKVREAKEQVRAWMISYRKNRWENQYYYPEILIEKKALIGTFERVCRSFNVGLGACKGYPSLTFLNDIADRMKMADESGKSPIILYFGDYDPSGEDIPRSIVENLEKDFGVLVELKRIALNERQVIDLKLPPAPVKSGDSRTANWDGLGQVELDAVKPEILESLVKEAIQEIFDDDKFDELIEEEDEEQERFVIELKEYVKSMDL